MVIIVEILVTIVPIATCIKLLVEKQVYMYLNLHPPTLIQMYMDIVMKYVNLEALQEVLQKVQLHQPGIQREALLEVRVAIQPEVQPEIQREAQVEIQQEVRQKVQLHPPGVQREVLLGIQREALLGIQREVQLEIQPEVQVQFVSESNTLQALLLQMWHGEFLLLVH